MNMKKNLTVLGAILLFACSESSNVTGTTEMENTMAKGESSSSKLLVSSEAERSSSSLEEMSSSSTGIYFPPPAFECKPSPLTKVQTYGVVDNFISKRVTILELQGLDNDAAKDSATEELYRELGLDSLFQDHAKITDSQLEYTLFHIYGDVDKKQIRQELIDDLADGVLDPDNFCFNSTPYATLNELPYNFMPLGCYTNPDDINNPLTILRNIWRKCSDMPYCNNDIEDSTIIVENKIFVCQNGSWMTFEMLKKEKNGVLCTKNGDRIVIREENNRDVTYICHDSLWRNILTTPDLPAEYFFNPDFEYGTFVDPRDGHVYRTTVYNGKTWLAQDMDYYDSSDTLFVKQSKCAKVANYEHHEECENVYCDGASRFYTVNVSKKVCPEGWRLPTKEDWNAIVDMSYAEAEGYFPKLYVLDSYYAQDATDEFGLSLRMDGFVEPYGRYIQGAGYNTFWLEEGEYVINFNPFAYYNNIDIFRENGEFVPVRCIKE